MIQRNRDKGLQKAVNEQSSLRLQPNFTYFTMQKVEKLAKSQQKKVEHRLLLCTITASLCLVGSCITILTIYFGDTLSEILSVITSTEIKKLQIPSFYGWILMGIPLFMLFDQWMRHQYFKRHKP